MNRHEHSKLEGVAPLIADPSNQYRILKFKKLIYREILVSPARVARIAEALE